MYVYICIYMYMHVCMYIFIHTYIENSEHSRQASLKLTCLPWSGCCNGARNGNVPQV